MGRGHAFTTLQLRGDMLEQLATRTESVAAAATSYAALWANHVLPAREQNNPAFVAGPLKDLAEFSYSALLRLLSAHLAADRVTNACAGMLSSESGDQIISMLAAQEGLFAFFSNAGAAIDLLNKAGETVSVTIFSVPDEKWGSGGWFYERRSGYVHERIAPVFVLDGLLQIDADLLTQKHPRWSKSVVSERELTDLVEELSALVCKTLGRGWDRLHDAVRKMHSPRLFMGGPTQQFSSASPRRPGG
jgi:phenylpyruvate tautomerase PptA (4-oxalocrotonate tautomerase family)